MPRTSNDIDYVKVKDPRTKTSRKPPPEPGPLLPFEPLQIDDYYDPGEAFVPSSIDRHDPIALFRLFFDDKMMDLMAVWTNAYTEAHLVPKKDAPRGKQRPWSPTCRQELYVYFAVVIYIGITIEPAIENYWGPLKKGAAYKVGDYISKN